MTESSAVRSASPDTSMQLQEIRQELTSLVSIVSAIGGAIIAVALLPAIVFDAPAFLTAGALALLGLAAYLVCGSYPFAARALLLVGYVACYAAALFLQEQQYIPYLALVPVAAIAATDPWMGAGAALLHSGALFALASGHPAFLPALALIWAVAVVTWLPSRGLSTALAWAWNQQRHMSQIMYELRQSQGDLNRTLVALTEASRRLQHTNSALMSARQEAEDARAAKEQFVANVSHELRTPLNLITGFVEEMYLTPETYEGVSWTSDLMGDLGRVYRAARHLQDLINDILDLAQIDVASLPMFREMLDLRSVLQEAASTVQPLFDQRRLGLELDLPEEPVILYADRTRIRQVMLNLLSNALRFTESGGARITLETSDQEATIHVADTGIGIPKDQLERIFEEFTQVITGHRSRGGAGLGLAISRRFVALHGGRMWAESEPAVGSTFSFSLPFPYAASHASNLQRTPDRRRVDHSHAPVVVLDPDPSVANMVERYLGDHPAIPAADVAEAEALIDETRPTAIIVNLPPEAPDAQWLGSLGEACSRYGVPVLRCSIPSASWLQHSSSFELCLSKPVSRDQVRKAVECHLPSPGTVLVVDDDPSFVSLVTRIITSLPQVQSVLAAYTGPEALRVAKEAHPDLVLLDLRLPEIDGFAVAEELLAEDGYGQPTIVAISATNYAETLHSQRAAQLTLTQTTGLSPGVMLQLLASMVEIVHPVYAGPLRTSSRVESN